MSTDPTGDTQKTITAMIRADPKLADPSKYIRAFASFLNDRWPEAEKSTPETEWRRMRDLWGGLQILGKGLVAMTRELEQSKQLSVDVNEQIQQNPKPKDDPFDPFNWTRDNVAPPGKFPGSPGITTTIEVLRQAGSNVLQIALQAQDILASYLPAIHQIAEDVAQLGIDSQQQIDTLSGDDAGINSVDYGLITDPVTISQDYGLVADVPLSDIDWGGID